MQNYWNLYVAGKQQQLYGPINYRDFRQAIRNPRHGLQNLSLFRIIFLGANCWNKVQHTEFLQPITKWELKKMFRTNPEREKPSVKCKDVHEALFTTAFRVSGYCFERFKFQINLLMNIFLHKSLYALYSIQVIKDRRKINQKLIKVNRKGKERSIRYWMQNYQKIN